MNQQDRFTKNTSSPLQSAHTIPNGSTANDTVASMSTDTSVDMQTLLDEKDARIQQFESQIEKLTSLVAMAQQNVSAVTEQNTLMLEDHRKKVPFWKRILGRGGLGDFYRLNGNG